MKKSIILILLFLLSQTIICNAQDTLRSVPPDTLRPVTKRDTIKKLELGIFYSHDYCLQTIKPITNNGGSGNFYNKQAADSLNNVESPEFGYTLGVDVICHFNEKLSLKTGFYYAVRTIKYNGFVFDNGIYPGYNIYRFTNYRKEKTSFFEIPLAFNYSFCSDTTIHKFRLSCFAGMIFSINNRTQTVETKRFWVVYNAPQSESSYITGTIDKFSVMYLGILAGIKAEYVVNKKFAFGLSPMIKYFPVEFFRSGHFSPLGDRVKKSPYSIGCGIGVTYFFYR